jgi:hypothetical protein
MITSSFLALWIKLRGCPICVFTGKKAAVIGYTNLGFDVSTGVKA